MKRALSLAVFGVAGMALALSPARAEDDGPKIEKHKVVIVDHNGERQVFEGDGPGVRRGYLGVGTTDLTPELRSFFGVPENAGVMISHVESGSPADKAGIKVGDILTVIDGKPVDNSWDVGARIRKYDEGERVALEVRRGGKAQNLTVAIALRERPEIDIAPMFLRDGNRMKIRVPGDGERMPEMDKQIRIVRPGPHQADLEKQIEKLEKRIQELEQKLQKN
jgi:membrane-associated protease RseP (regulator of RpoE activity)